MTLTHIAKGVTLSALVGCSALALQAQAGQGDMKGQSGHKSDSSGMMQSGNPGQQHSAVRQVQQMLQDKGYDVGTIDGTWGDQSTAALKKYQRQNGLAATGKLDRDTADKLGISSGEFARFEEQTRQGNPMQQR